MHPLEWFSLQNWSGWPLVSATNLPAAKHCRYASAQRGVIGAAHAIQVGHQFVIQRDAALLQHREFSRGSLQQLGRLPAVAAPVRTQVLLHVLDRVQIVVRQQQASRNRFFGHGAQVERDRRRHGLRRSGQPSRLACK